MSDDKTDFSNYAKPGADITLYSGPAEGISQIQTPAIKDTTEVSDVSAVPPKGYNSLASRPQIPKPKPLPKNTPDGFDYALNALNSFPEVVLELVEGYHPPEVDDSPLDDIEEELANVDPEALSSIGGGNPKKGIARLRYAVFHPKKKYQPQLEKLAASIRQKAVAKSGVDINENFVDLADEASNVFYQGCFEVAVRSADISDEEKKQIFFAHDIPEAADLLPPKLRAILKEAEASALIELTDEIGVPPDWPIPRDGEFKAKLAQEFSAQASQVLSKMETDGQISMQEYNELRTLLFIPESKAPNAQQSKQLQDILQTVTAQLKKDFGVPDGFNLTPDSTLFKNMLNGTFFLEFKKQLHSQALSPEDMAAIEEALVNPAAAEALPPELKTIFDSLKAAALNKLKSLYGLDSSWMPDPEALASAATRTKTQNFMVRQGAIDQAFEAVETGREILNALKSNDPSYKVLSNYLDAVSSALIGLQEQLSINSVADSGLATSLTQIEKDSKLSQLEQRRTDLQKVMEKQKKMASMGPLKVLFQWLVMITLMVFCAPVGVALLLNSFVKNIVDHNGKLDFGQFMKMELIQDMGKSLTAFGKQIGGELGKTIASIATTLSVVLISAVCPAALLVDIMFGDGLLLKEFINALPISKQLADQIATYLQIALQVIGTIAMMFFTGGTSLAFSASEFATQMAVRFGLSMTKIAQTVGNVGLKIAQAIVKVLDYIEKVMAPVLQAIDHASPAVGMFLRNAGSASKDVFLAVLRYFEEIVQVATDHAEAIEGLVKGGFDRGTIKQAFRYANMVARRISIFTGTVTNGWKTAVQVQNKVLQSQIEELRGAIESNAALMDGLLKAIKAIINKLLEALRGIAQDLKDVTENHKKLFEDTSSVLANLFQV